MKLTRQLKRVVIGALGVTVVLVGVAMIILPGPAFIVIPCGLAILAAEFAWARRLFRSARAALPKSARDKVPKNPSVTSVKRRAVTLWGQVRKKFLPHTKPRPRSA